MDRVESLKQANKFILAASRSQSSTVKESTPGLQGLGRKELGRTTRWKAQVSISLHQAISLKELG